jgi:hypothetical protein
MNKPLSFVTAHFQLGKQTCFTAEQPCGVGLWPARDAKRRVGLWQDPHERLQAESSAGDVSCDTTLRRQAKGLLHKEGFSLSLLTLLLCAALNAATVTVRVSPTADPVEKLAASELANYLGKLYPADQFSVGTSGKPPSIILGTPRDTPDLAQFKDRLSTPESFVVAATGPTAYIAGADPRGTLFGVYALLEKLGCGFYISYDTLPAPRNEPFGFAQWKLADAPLYGDRIVFDWHNFLSSASSWELEDWQRYISQAAKMRFNTIMVHAYGNNPMYQFRYHGLVKPVGYLTTTRSGRDWGTQHVNDVRRMIGGEAFDDPVFGASVAKVPESQRAEAATALMKKVFAHARSRGLGVTFALDVDTESANPQEIIATLPASARFHAGKYDLANPDTPEGYAYFKAQIEQLLAAYPEINRLAIWFRGGATCWTAIKLDELPAAWRPEYDAVIAKYPALGNGPQSPGFFAVGKLVRAARRVLQDLKRTDVELATGNWRLSFTASCRSIGTRCSTPPPGSATCAPLFPDRK